MDKYKIEDYNKYVYSGLITGTVQTFVESPFEVMKTQMMFNNNNSKININEAELKKKLDGFEKRKREILKVIYSYSENMKRYNIYNL